MASLRRRVDAQRKEIDTLESALRPKAADKAAMARRIMDLQWRMEDLNDAEKKEWIRLRNQIDRDMAPFFAAGYRKRLKEGVSIVNELPIHFVWQAGGPEGADLLLERLEDPNPVPYERNAILLMIAGTRMAYHEMEAFAITPAVATKARQWVNSENHIERAAAAGMLGGMDPMESRPLLLRMLEDKDFLVRAAAVKALGRVGDDATLHRLTAFESAVHGTTGPNWEQLNPALRDAIQRLYQEKLKREGK